MDQERNLLRTLAEAEEKAILGQKQSAAELAFAMYDISRGARVALDVAEELMPLLGPSAVYRTNPLTRIYRDLITARQHATQNPELYAPPVGNIELGKEGANFFILPDDVAAAARERGKQTYG